MVRATAKNLTIRMNGTPYLREDIDWEELERQANEVPESAFDEFISGKYTRDLADNLAVLELDSWLDNLNSGMFNEIFHGSEV
jgi:hypothetical protein